MFEPGDVVLAFVQFTDSFEVKKRPALLLFEEKGNFVVAGITSNLDMDGISITREEGAAVDSVIKLNYIFTVAEALIVKKLFTLNKAKRHLVYEELRKRLEPIKVT